MRIMCALYHQTNMMRSKMTICNVDNSNDVVWMNIR